MEIKALNSNRSKQKNQPSNPDMPKPPFVVSIAAPRGSGKSNLILNLLTRKDMLKNVFHPKDIFVFSPSADINRDYEGIKCNLVSDFKNDTILDIIEKQKDLIIRHGQSNTTPLLIILDDCLGSSKAFNHNSAAELLSIRGRHVLISIIIVSQSLRRISRTIRLNTDYLIFFKPANLTELDAFVEEYIQKSQKKLALSMIKNIFKVPYSFIVVDLKTKEDGRKYRINFSTPIEFEINTVA